MPKLNRSKPPEASVNSLTKRRGLLVAVETLPHVLAPSAVARPTDHSALSQDRASRRDATRVSCINTSHNNPNNYMYGYTAQYMTKACAADSWFASPDAILSITGSNGPGHSCQMCSRLRRCRRSRRPRFPASGTIAMSLLSLSTPSSRTGAERFVSWRPLWKNRMERDSRPDRLTVRTLMLPSPLSCRWKCIRCSCPGR